MSYMVSFHLDVNVVFAWLDLTSFIAQEVYFPSATSNNGIHLFQTSNAHESRNVGITDHCSTKLVVMVLTLHIFNRDGKG